ncbi:MAG: sulfurtransferase [Steroidobacteraceae bacterium]
MSASRLSLFALLLVASLVGVARAAVLPGPLVTPEWLAANADKVVILDVRDYPEEYRGAPTFETDANGKKSLVEVGGHIPGARLVDFAKIRTARVIDGRKISGMVLEASAFEQLMQQAGVKAGQAIVIASTGSAIEDFDGAARLYWTLKYYGAKEIAILDGGYVRWLDEGRPTEDAPPAVTAGDWVASAPRDDLLADTTEVQAAMSSGLQLVDARPLAFFFGLTKRSAVAAYGHIPGSRVLPTDLRAKPQGSGFRYLAADDYRRALAGMQIESDRPTITYCNTGHMAAGAWFILSEVLGNPAVSLYDGSMVEWADGKRPVANSR